MTNLPKELVEMMIDVHHRMFEKSRSYNFTSVEQRAFNTGVADCFNDCYQSMLKTHVPKEKVDKLVEALIEMKNMLWTKQAEIHRVLKEYEGENV